MATIKIPYLVQKGTSWYWTPGPQLRAAGWRNVPLGKDQAQAEAKARNLNAEAAAGADAKRHTGPLTVRHLIQRWQASPHFTGVRANTQRDYRYRCRVVDDWCGDAELQDLTRGLVRDWHRACHAQHGQKANRALAMLRQLYNYAIEHELTDQNPADKVQPLKTERQAVYDWQPRHVRHMVQTADTACDGKGCSLFSVGTAIVLNEWAGQRLTDLLLMDADHIQDGVWQLTQSKTGAQLFLPIGMVPGLTERLAEQQARNLALGYNGPRMLVSEATGKPYIEPGQPLMSDHFAQRFRRLRKLAAETMPDCDLLLFQKLRRFAATEAEDAGATEGQLNSVGGWEDNSSASPRYRRRTQRQAEQVFQARLIARGEAVGT